MPARRRPPFALSETDSGHGRIEVRAIGTAACEPQQTGLPAVRQAIVLRATRTIKKTGQSTTFDRAYVTSYTPSERGVSALAATIRAHWGIENRNHWRRDACWGEDTRCRFRKPNAACAMALLRSALLLPALTAGQPSLNALAERAAGDKRFALNLLNKRNFHW